MAAQRRQLGGVDRLPSGRYRVRLTDPATGARVSAGTFTNKADAERAFASAVTAQDRGTWVAPRTTLTLADYSDQWLESRLTSKGARLRPRVRELYEGQLRLHILPTLGRAPLAKLRPPTVRSWYTALVDDGPGAITAAKCYRLLRAILNTAVEDGLIAVNPCTIRGAGAERSPERIIPTLAQVAELADTVDPRYRALVILAAFGGLRRGELIVGPPKSGAGRRTVALPPQAIVALQSHLDRWTDQAADAWMFTGVKGGRYGTRSGSTSGISLVGASVSPTSTFMTSATCRRRSRPPPAPG